MHKHPQSINDSNVNESSMWISFLKMCNSFKIREYLEKLRFRFLQKISNLRTIVKTEMKASSRSWDPIHDKRKLKWRRWIGKSSRQRKSARPVSAIDQADRRAIFLSRGARAFINIYYRGDGAAIIFI